MGIHECLLAPCGVSHGGPLAIETNTLGATSHAADTLWGGFASPPQGDLYLRGGYIKNQCIKDPPSVRFKNIEPIE